MTWNIPSMQNSFLNTCVKLIKRDSAGEINFPYLMPFEMLRRNIVKLVLNRRWLILLISMIINIANLLVYYFISEECFTPTAMVLVGDSLMCIVLFLERWVNLNSKSKDIKIKRLKRILVAMLFILVIILLSILYKVILFGSNATSNSHSGEFHNQPIWNTPKRSGFLVITIFSILLDGLVMTECWPFTLSVLMLLYAFSFLIEFILGLLLLLISAQFLYLEEDYRKLSGLYLFASAFIISGGVLGFGVIISIDKKRRFLTTTRQLINYLIFFYLLTTLLLIIAFADSASALQNSNHSWISSIPILFGICFLLNILLTWNFRNLGEKLPASLVAEELDLRKLTSYQKECSAKLITANSRNNPGVPGEQIMALMEAYTTCKLSNLRCTVLRVYNPNKVNKEGQILKKNKSSNTYCDENFFFDERKEDNTNDILEGLKLLSKNQRKRLLKKKLKTEQDHLPDMLNSSSEVLDDMNFYIDLKSTEALVLFTVIDRYDLTHSFESFLGRVLSKYFGAESYTKLLTIRIGLLGFHWPFRRSVFFCGSSKDNVAKNALVMKGVAKYNSKQKKKSTILLDPLYKTPFSENAIQLSKWISIELPATNITDLRPYQKKTLSQFFKANKYRTHMDAFKNAGGCIIEEQEESDISCDTAYKLWSNTANNRKEKHLNGYLANPDKEFLFLLLKNHNEYQNRSLLFLRVNDKIIASCVIFRLGETITSDLQGLDYELGKKHKAYFVMMESIIEIAFREGIKFVDFGPTTDDAKKSIGAQSVEIMGGLYTFVPGTSTIIRFAANKVNV